MFFSRPVNSEGHIRAIREWTTARRHVSGLPLPRDRPTVWGLVTIAQWVWCTRNESLCPIGKDIHSSGTKKEVRIRFGSTFFSKVVGFMDTNRFMTLPSTIMNEKTNLLSVYCRSHIWWWQRLAFGIDCLHPTSPPSHFPSPEMTLYGWWGIPRQ